MLDSFRDRLPITRIDAARAFLLDVAGSEHRYCGALLSLASSVQGNEAPEFLVGCLRFSAHILEQRAEARYSRILLTERWLDLGTVAELFSTMAHRTGAGEETTESAMTFHDTYTQTARTFTQASGERVYTQDLVGNYSEGAETVILLEGRGANVEFDHHPAVGFGLTPYVTIADAASSWCFGRGEHYGGSFRERGKLCVVAPETRARVVDVSLRTDSLCAVVQGSLSLSAEVQFVFSGEGTATRRESLPVSGPGPHELLVGDPSRLGRLDIFVVDRSNDPVCHVALWMRHLRDEEQRHPIPGVETELEAGETEEVEFKPWLDKDKEVTKKLREIVRSIIAFANTKGGRVYVGVDDEGVPLGISAARKVGGSSPEEALDITRKMIDRAVRNTIIPVPDFSIDTVEAHGHPLLAVNVKSGPSTPYASEQNDIYVRRGATNRRPEPRTELAPLFNSR
jgi:schlafen family protein